MSALDGLGPHAGANRNLLAATALVDELARCGVRHLCLSPGSRSAPLALAAHADPRIEVSVHTDERCGGFFALGLARASGRPVALACTSGTAGAHWLPALLEADRSRIPLIALTADRPPELLDCGAPQTMRQDGLFGSCVRMAQTIGPPAPEARWIRWLRSRVDRACELATGAPAGPVHLNLQFDEPLSPTPVPGDVPAGIVEADRDGVLGRADGRPLSPWTSGAPRLSAGDLEALRARLGAAKRPVIIAGPEAVTADGRGPLIALARALGAPLLADPLSGVRGAESVTGYDAFLRVRVVARALGPDLVLHLGRTPTSKFAWQWLATHPGAERVVIDPSGDREDPSLAGSTFVRAEAAALLPLLSGTRSAAEAGWIERWRRLDGVVARARAAARDAPVGFEASLVAALDRLPADARLLVASSMPIRQLDAFWPGGTIEVVANRGVNGIDGLVSTAFGMAAADRARPGYVVLGDLALLHDLGGLAAARRMALPLVIVVVNNGGGGIFSYLPLAETDAAAPGGAFEPLFLTPHRTDFADAASLFGLEYAAPRTHAELADALQPATGAARLVELVVERDDSVARHRRFWSQVALDATAEV